MEPKSKEVLNKVGIISPSVHIFGDIFGFVLSSGAHRLFLSLYSVITPTWFKGPYWLLGTKPELVMWKTNALPHCTISLVPQFTLLLLQQTVIMFYELFINILCKYHMISTWYSHIKEYRWTIAFYFVSFGAHPAMLKAYFCFYVYCSLLAGFGGLSVVLEIEFSSLICQVPFFPVSVVIFFLSCCLKEFKNILLKLDHGTHITTLFDVNN